MRKAEAAKQNCFRPRMPKHLANIGTGCTSSHQQMTVLRVVWVIVLTPITVSDSTMVSLWEARMIPKECSERSCCLFWLQ